MRRMFICLTALTALTLVPAPARAESSFTIEPLVYLESTKRPDPSVGGMLFHRFDGSKWGVSGFWWVMKDWAEFHGGPTYSPVQELTLALDVGVQQDGRGNLSGRYATGFLWTPTKMLAFSGMLEVDNNTFRGDASGMWYDLLATATPFTRLTAGARARRFVGVGPFAQLNVPEAHTKVWVLWAAVDPERVENRWPFSSGLMGLTFDF